MMESDGLQVTDSSMHRLARRAGQRDPSLRSLYARTALGSIPRLLTLMDRNPYRETYGCLDRNYWHYRTADFPSGMYQEGVLPLAMVWAHRFEGNRWYADPQVREFALAGIRYAVRRAHADGACDDYYPYERALGAAVFALYACAEAYRLLQVHDLEILAGLEKRARWLLSNDESGRLTNHQAWAALALHTVYQLTGDPSYLAGTEWRLRTVLHWQSREGWFQEYDGCDPGYLTVTIDALAKYWRRTNDPVIHEALRRAVAFARHFLHPDDSFGGHYGSRGTCHFYPHGLEILAGEDRNAAALAEGFLRSLAGGTTAAFEDDRLFTHRSANLLQAYLDWQGGGRARLKVPRGQEPRDLRVDTGCEEQETGTDRYFPEARIYVRRLHRVHAVVSSAKGGALKLYVSDVPAVSDAGILVELEDGRVCTTHLHGEHAIEVESGHLSIAGTMHWVAHETATPLKQILFRLGLLLIGRRRPQQIRKYLQRRLITGRREAPVTFHRTIRWGPPVEVVDVVELTDPSLEVRRMAIASDASSIYTAAGDVYDPSQGGPWLDLSRHVEELNDRRRVTVRRTYG